MQNFVNFLPLNKNPLGTGGLNNVDITLSLTLSDVEIVLYQRYLKSLCVAGSIYFAT